MADCSLHELDQLTRRGTDGDLVQFGDDRPRGMRPGHALAGVEEATGAKHLVDGCAQCSKVSVGARRDEPHHALDVLVALGRRADHFDQFALSSRAMTCSIGVSAERPRFGADTARVSHRASSLPGRPAWTGRGENPVEGSPWSCRGTQV